jgi:ATP-dependent Lhr-like helicase
VPIHVKNRLDNNNQAILLITPESLEAMLINNPNKARFIFKNSISIVIDEFHSFLGNDRGDQLRSLLNRLDKFAKYCPRRIGLSATIGDENYIINALDSKNSSNTKIINESISGKHSIKLSLKGYENELNIEEEELENTSPEEIERKKNNSPDILITKDIFRFRDQTNLVFPNSIRNVENFVYEGNFLCNQKEEDKIFFPHHSLLSNNLRKDVEGKAKEGKKPMTIVCTSTLELGIDIGSVDNVFQIYAPLSVASLRQRLGRSGRRGNDSVLRIHIVENCIKEDPKYVDLLRYKLVKTIAILKLMSEDWYETDNRSSVSLCITAHQILALLKQLGGATAEDIWFFFKEKNTFNLDINIFKNLLNYLKEKELILQISRKIYLSDQGSDLTDNFRFYTCFESVEEYQIYALGKKLGIIPFDSSLDEGDNLLFAGQKWEIKKIDKDKRIVEVVNSTIKGSVPSTKAETNVDTKILEKMKIIYEEEEIPIFLDAKAKKLLTEAKEFFEKFDLKSQNWIPISDESIRWFPWVGTKTRTTIDLMISQFTNSKSNLDSDDLSLVININEFNTLQDFLLNKKSEEIYDDLFNNLLINVDNIYLQNTGKWSWLLSPENKVRDFMMRQLNIQEAMNAILNFKI